MRQRKGIYFFLQAVTGKQTAHSVVKWFCSLTPQSAGIGSLQFGCTNFEPPQWKTGCGEDGWTRVGHLKVIREIRTVK